MFSEKSLIQIIALKFGMIILFFLIGFFFLMKLIGLVHIVELRSLNFFIMVAGVWLAIKAYKKDQPNGIAYMDGLGLGIRTILYAVIPFALFILIYLSVDTSFMESIRLNEMFGAYLNPFVLSFLIAFEGAISGFFIAYTILQYEKCNIAANW